MAKGKIKGEGTPTTDPVVIHAPSPEIVCVRCGNLTYSLGKNIPYCKKCYMELSARGLL